MVFSSRSEIQSGDSFGSRFGRLAFFLMNQWKGIILVSLSFPGVCLDPFWLVTHCLDK